MTFSISTAEELRTLKSNGWQVESHEIVEGNLSQGLGRRVKAKLTFYDDSLGDTTTRTGLYFLGCLPVLASSLFCSALCCACSSQSSRFASSHVEAGGQGNPDRFVRTVHHDRETTEGQLELSEATQNAAAESLNWNAQFVEKMAPFNGKTYIREVLTKETDFQAVFGNNS